jgi:hypothetical protein
MAAYLHTLQTLRTTSERYAIDNALVSAIKEYMDKATCDFEAAISHFDANQGTDENAVRCGASADCKECLMCAGHCECSLFGGK